MDAVIRTDIPSTTYAVFGEDGRVFVDLDYIIESLTPGYERQKFGADILKTDINDGIVTGMSLIMDSLVRSRECLILEAAMDEKD